MLQSGFYKFDNSGCRLFIRIKPNSSKNEIEKLAQIGTGKTTLHVRIQEPAAENKANKALIKFISRHLNYPQSKISLLRGHKSRDKTLHIEGEATDIKSRLEVLIAGIEC